MAGARGEHQGALGAAQVHVEPVDLVARRAAAKPLLPDQPLAHPVEHPRQLRVPGRVGPPVGHARAGALPAEADPEQRVAAHAPGPPQAAPAPVEAADVLPARCRKGAGPDVAPADLEPVRAGGCVSRAHPVEAVAAQVHEVPAAPREPGVRAEGLEGGVLRVRARDDGVEPRERARPAGVQVVVGDDLVGDAQALQEPDHHQVGRELARAGEGPHDVTGPDVEERAPARGEDDARAVAVDVVQRQAEVGAAADLLESGGFLGAFHVEVVAEDVAARLEQALVGVGEVCECREDEADLGGVVSRGPPPRGPHEEGYRVLVLPAAGLRLDRVGAGAGAGWDRDGEVCFPRRVVEVVVVEVYGAVPVSCPRPVAL